MLWNAGIVLATALLVLLGLREGVRRALVHELDAILLEDLKEVRLALADAPSPDDPQLFEELNRKAAGHQAHRWFVRFLDAEGRTVWVSLNGPARVLPFKGLKGKPFGVGRYRLVQDELPRPRGRVTAVRVGASTDLIEADVRRLDRLVAVTVLFAVVAAPLCGYWLAGLSLRPVADIIDTASRLRPNRLDERLPNRGTGDELDKLAATVNRLLDRIADYLRERRDFLANSAHELRSPLAAIRSTVEVALQSGRLPPQDEETFAVVIDQCRSLEHLVNQLLLLAETEAERLTDRAEEVRLDRLVATAVDMFAAAAELKDVTIRTAALEPAVVRGNRSHLRQVVNNLLDNAVKFTPARGNVTADLRLDGMNAVLTVADTGTGIAAEDLPHVFDRFFRGDRSRQRDGRGTGLGLSICRAVVTACGGTITAESRPGDGTTIVVTLPNRPPADGETPNQLG
ncbi:MAG TPA: PAS domain-containing sensor histidine kinase [Planctomycetaceae bacterium]